jgi:DNA-binding transcriptional ArsR family regulator
MWPLLADALREESPAISFAQILSALSSMDDAAFQRSVLGGVFKVEGAVDGLMSGKASLKRTVKKEAASQQRLLRLLGLEPFNTESPSAYAFDRIVSQPATYRAEMVAALDMFWQIGFSDTWTALQSQMHSSARAMKTQISRTGLASLLAKSQMPVSMERIDISASHVHLIPSAFNLAKLWAAYKDSHERVTFYIPVLDRSLHIVGDRATEEPTSRNVAPAEPAKIFKALGDTTRYAIATTLARTPMTSVELAKLFKVSKPTISHHVALLRDAGLLTERQTESGSVLALNRRSLERASAAAAAEMYSEDGPDHVVKRSRRNKQ